MTAPVWLNEEPWLQKWLGWFIDRLETPRSQGITRRIKKSTLPELYAFGEDTAYRWQLLEMLASEYSVFEITYDKKLDRHQERYENAQFRLIPESEALLREWLNRPRIDPVTKAWREALSHYSNHFSDHGESLLVTKPNAPGYTPAELVDSFVNVANYLGKGLTLREIASRCFQGDSKFLDQRQDLLIKLYGEKAANIQPRPLLLTAWAPEKFTRLLIVENQDSFLRLVDNPPEDYALLYSGGFRASATRLSSEHTRFAFLPSSDPNAFHQSWLNDSLPVFFWGDLDFSGMGILKALKTSLPQLKAWLPGYQPMLEILNNNGGHLLDQTGKANQVDPGLTGCTYCDETLLPILRLTKKGVDQEIILLNHPRARKQDQLYF